MYSCGCRRPQLEAGGLRAFRPQAEEPASLRDPLPPLRHNRSEPLLHGKKRPLQTRGGRPDRPPTWRSKVGFNVPSTPTVAYSYPELQSSPSSHAPLHSYQDACARRGILPKFVRATRNALSEGDLDLSYVGLGNQQLGALLRDSELLPADEVRHWRLCDARLSGQGVAALAQALAPAVETLDLARNDVGAEGAGALAKAVARGGLRHLRTLDLSSCGLGDEAVKALLPELERCASLACLRLNRNRIQDGAALGRLVARHACLERVSLSFNSLSGAGASLLFRGVLESVRGAGQIAMIDVAWNEIGMIDGLSAAGAIGAVLRESVTLYHLDMSYNCMNAACCAAIAEGLRDNHFLFGLHIVGNAATMDANGFLSPLPEGHAPLPPQSVPPAVEFGGPQNAQKVADHPPAEGSAGASREARQAPACCRPRATDIRDRDVLEQQTSCWACEGWERVDLDWSAAPGEPPPRAVWAFTSLDGFRAGLRLRWSQAAKKFTAARMAPPRCKLLVIYQVDDALRVSPHMHAETLDKPAEIELLACDELPELRPSAEQEVVSRNVSTLPSGEREHRIVLRQRCAGVVSEGSRERRPIEVGSAGGRVVLVDGPNGVGVTMPRVTETEFRMKTQPPRGPPFFAKFKKRGGAFFRECASTDFSHAKISRLVPEAERESVLQVFKDHYEEILAIYRYLSSLDATSDSGFGIGQLQACDLMISAGLADDAHTKISDIDRLFIGANVLQFELRNKIVVGSDKSLMRFQFLEFLLRVARQRFIEKCTCNSLQDALQRVLRALAPISGARLAEMRAFLAALHTEAVDDVFRQHFGILNAVFTSSCGRSVASGRASCMSFASFEELLDTASAYEGDFQQRKAGVAFRMGMTMQVDELYDTRFMEMNFMEFQHAIGAVVFLRMGGELGELDRALDEFMTTNLCQALGRFGRRKSCKPERKK